jgi:hypothetical protein
LSIVMFRQMYYTWDNRIQSWKGEREDSLPEEDKEQAENTSRNVGIRRVGRENYCKVASVWMEDFVCYHVKCCNLWPLYQ